MNISTWIAEQRIKAIMCTCILAVWTDRLNTKSKIISSALSVTLRPRDSGIEVEKLKSISIFEVIHVFRMKNVTLRIEDVRTSVYLNRCMQSLMHITKTLPVVIIYFLFFRLCMIQHQQHCNCQQLYNQRFVLRNFIWL